MGTFSIWHWLIVIIFAVAIGVPSAKILSRAGRSRWWTVVALIPYVNIIGLWVFAFTRWPADRNPN